MIAPGAATGRAMWDEAGGRQQIGAPAQGQPGEARNFPFACCEITHFADWTITAGRD